MPVKEVSVRNFCANSAIAIDYANGTIAFLQYTITDVGEKSLRRCPNML